MIAALFLLLFLMLFFAAPVFVALSFSSLSSFGLFSNMNLMAIVQRMLGGIDKFSLISVPFFILGANVMKNGGIANRILIWVQVWVGHLKGGLALSTEAACMFFGAVSGSSPATVVAIGGLMYPALLKSGYDNGFTTGLITSSGSVALLIPPSISAIIYGAVTGASVGALFMAGVGAGLLYGLLYLLYSVWYAHKKGIYQDQKTSWKERVKATKEAAWALGIPIIIMGGIYGGIFTPTEASGVSAVYAILVSMFVYKEMDLKKLVKTCIDSAETTAQVMMLLAAASAFGWILTVGQVPQALSKCLIHASVTKVTFLLLTNVILLVAGMFIDGSSAIVIMAPLLYPLAIGLGISPIHYGVIMVANAAIGMFTPPFGMNLFVAQPITNNTMVTIIKGVMPFVIISVIALIIITYVPSISLFLPQLVYGRRL
ncbi:TRAP transporter large permease [Fretibacterium sp. OH1220_COT-178]|uniref:TRAP transporter large permease n=1 Tax=Fretibacterium sp. OH1220_COT-178 TaxID=2491047 RepID=UPI000F5E3821|nr:TRAP transporter large permease [Fretibacterium sp. OH1220_COT-178]RRD65995.1 TRAP transporter large permease [Fretibacterium sp. OH1220_COT-178]